MTISKISYGVDIPILSKIKGSDNDNSITTLDEDLSNNNRVDLTPQKAFLEENGLKTIEDLVTIYNLYEKGEKYFKNLEQDINAMKNKVENLDRKVQNAKLYIEEIDSHKKSIFEFWKFANKDENLALEMGNTENPANENASILKTFDFRSKIR